MESATSVARFNLHGSKFVRAPSAREGASERSERADSRAGGRAILGATVAEN